MSRVKWDFWAHGCHLRLGIYVGSPLFSKTFKKVIFVFCICVMWNKPIKLKGRADLGPNHPGRAQLALGLIWVEQGWYRQERSDLDCTGLIWAGEGWFGSKSPSQSQISLLQSQIIRQGIFQNDVYFPSPFTSGHCLKIDMKLLDVKLSKASSSVVTCFRKGEGSGVDRPRPWPQAWDRDPWDNWAIIKLET